MFPAAPRKPGGVGLSPQPPRRGSLAVPCPRAPAGGGGVTGRPEEAPCPRGLGLAGQRGHTGSERRGGRGALGESHKVAPEVLECLEGPEGSGVRRRAGAGSAGVHSMVSHPAHRPVPAESWGTCCPLGRPASLRAGLCAPRSGLEPRALRGPRAGTQTQGWAAGCGQSGGTGGSRSAGLGRGQAACRRGAPRAPTGGWPVSRALRDVRMQAVPWRDFWNFGSKFKLKHQGRPAGRLCQPHRAPLSCSTRRPSTQERVLLSRGTSGTPQTRPPSPGRLVLLIRSTLLSDQVLSP